MLCEINPLIVTPDGEVKALDSKFTVDDNALFRHPDIAEMRDPSGLPARGARGAREGRHVREARRLGRDPRQRRRARRCRRWTSSRSRAAGRRTSATSAAAATRRASSTRSRSSRATRRCKSILFNIFGGITRCDEVARGILEALEQMTIERADRRAARRHERGGGAALLAEAAPPNLTSSRRCSTPRGARWSCGDDGRLDGARARRTATSEAHTRGRRPRPDRRVGGRARATAIDVATGGGHVARRLRERGLQCRHAPTRRRACSPT